MSDGTFICHGVEWFEGDVCMECEKQSTPECTEPDCPVCKAQHDFPARCWVEQQEKGMEMTNPLLIAAYQAVIEDMKTDSENFEPDFIESIIETLKTRVWELETIWSKSDDEWNAEVEAFFESEIEARLPEEEEDNE